MLIGIELVQDKQSKEPYTDLLKQVLTKAIEKKLILISCGVHANVIRLAPPLIISKQELQQGLSILCEILNDHR